MLELRLAVEDSTLLTETQTQKAAGGRRRLVPGGGAPLAAGLGPVAQVALSCSSEDSPQNRDERERTAAIGPTLGEAVKQVQARKAP